MSSSKSGDDPTTCLSAKGGATPPPKQQRPSGPKTGGWDERSHTLALVARYTRAHVRSTYEVLTYLKRRGVSPEVASKTVVEAQRHGILDDVAAARLSAEHWARAGYAWTAIHQKLSEKGFHAHTIDTVATSLGDASADEARAREVVARQLRRKTGVLQRTRVARTLILRGFDSELIERILHESFGPRPSDAER